MKTLKKIVHKNAIKLLSKQIFLYRITRNFRQYMQFVCSNTLPTFHYTWYIFEYKLLGIFCKQAYKITRFYERYQRTNGNVSPFEETFRYHILKDNIINYDPRY